MLINTFEIEGSIFDAIRNDASMIAYVKSFTRGDMNISRKRFPFVSLGNLAYREKQLLAASGIFTYTVTIYAGTSSLAHNVAYQGSEAGTK